ncbi:alpha/beta hydrolase [Oceanobacillus kapialis]|uniref:Alpha/beta hydrolase n=1 Tax=Oceanobacillus kapialis TaxID=481353 RepID=A0ABW5PVZ2_9BACI
MKEKTIARLIVGFLVLSGMFSVSYLSDQNKPDINATKPTVFLHGYKGTYNSFGFMLDRFENKYNWGSKALIYNVSANGEIVARHLGQGNSKPEFIQVILEDNRAGFTKSAAWLASVLKHLKRYYDVNTINLVGHSMGGIVSFEFLKQYTDKGLYPEVDKFVAIGSPFDGIYSEEYFQFNYGPAATDLMPNSSALDMLHERSFPDSVSVLNIGSTGDSVAVPESVGALRQMIPANQFEEVIIDDKNLGHSALHENQRVDRLIYSFLWKDNS